MQIEAGNAEEDEDGGMGRERIADQLIDDDVSIRIFGDQKTPL